MVKRFVKLAGIAAVKAKSILFADPKLLYREERNLLNKPFFFEGTNGKGVLLLHGWSSTPYELRRLGKYLNESGYTVLGIQLTGHGTVPKDLENVSSGQWISDAKNGLNELRKTCGKVYIGGTSIGANLAMILAKEDADVSALILMATPYKLRMESIGLFFVKMAMFFGMKYRNKFYPPTFGLSTTITRSISYQSYPLKNLLEVYETVKAARSNLSEITQPCFVLQSTHDHIINKDSLEHLYDEVGSKIKKKLYIKKAYHTFISDIKNEHIFMDILNFLNEN
jgi:carboxylesterase